MASHRWQDLILLSLRTSLSSALDNWFRWALGFLTASQYDFVGHIFMFSSGRSPDGAPQSQLVRPHSSFVVDVCAESIAFYGGNIC